MIIVAMASVLSFLPTHFFVAGIEMKPIHFFSDLIKENRSSDTIPKVIVQLPKGFVDADSISFHKDYSPLVDFDSSSNSAFKKFVNKLVALKKNKSKIRIAWFGDSLIEGDIFVQHIRSLLQKTFGGSGVGFVPITTNVPGFRKNINHTFSSDWKTFSQVDSVKAKVPYGLCGEVFMPRINQTKSNSLLVADTVFNKNAGSWASYSTTHYDSLVGIDTFHIVKLYYMTGDSNASVCVSLNHQKPTLKFCKVSDHPQELTLYSGKGIHAVDVQFNCSDTLFVYGLSFEDSSGIYIDNYSLRGSSGWQLGSLRKNVCSGLNADLNYDLLVLQYGVNVANEKTEDYTWYSKGMLNVISSLKRNFDSTAILICSSSDRSIKTDGEFVTMPSLLNLIAQQQKISATSQVAFWNLFDAMGGSGSMAALVDSPLPLANKDYTHLKPAGGKKLSFAFYDALMLETKKQQWQLSQPKKPATHP